MDRHEIVNNSCDLFIQVTNLTPNQAAAQAIQLFSQEARLCDRSQPSKVPRTSLEPGPASLAKRLPVKSMNPTCSIEGTASKSSITRSPSIPETLPRQVQIEVVPNPRKNTITCEVPKLPSTDSLPKGNSPKHMTKKHLKKSAPKRVIKKTKRSKAPDTQSESNLTDRDDSSATDDSYSNHDESSMSRAFRKNFSRLSYKNNVQVSKRNNRNVSDRRLARPKARKSVEKKRNTRNYASWNKKSSSPRARRRIIDNSKRFVRELLVLALYLRYLDAKRYSRTHGRRNNYVRP